MFTVANIPLILVLAGIIALLAGLFGGGLTIQSLTIPKITTVPRVISGLVGLALIGVGLFVHPGTPLSPAATPTSALPAATATLTSTPEATFTPPPSPTATQTVGPGTPIPTPPTPTPIVPDKTIPAGFLRYFFNLVTVNRDYGEAWTLMTRKFQRASFPGGSSAMAQYWSAYKQVDIDSLQVNQLDPNTVGCAVVLTYHSTSGLTSQVTATYRLIYNSSLSTWVFDLP